MNKEKAKQTALIVLKLKKEPKEGLLKVFYQILINELCKKNNS